MTRRPKRSGLFVGFWTTLEGARLERAKRADLAEAYRLRAKHADVCAGVVDFTLEQQDREVAKDVARARLLNGRALQQQRTAPRKRDPWLELDSTGAELAVARVLGVAWNEGRSGPEYGGDLRNGDEVRFTRLANGGLISQDGDIEERRYWLVTGRFPSYRLVGWLLGAELLKYENRNGDRGKDSAYRIAPQSDLRPVLPL